MKRPSLIFALAVLVWGCSPDGKDTYTLAQKENTKTSGESGRKPTGMESMTVSGLDLWMLGKPTADGMERPPTFRVHAESGEADANMNYSLSEPRAVIYDEAGEEIVLTSDKGDFDQESEKAHLRGDVLVVSGKVRFTMNEITWDNKPELAYTNTGATLESEMANLTADRLVINPNTSGIEMRNVTGTIELGGLN